MRKLKNGNYKFSKSDIKLIMSYITGCKKCKSCIHYSCTFLCHERDLGIDDEFCLYYSSYFKDYLDGSLFFLHDLGNKEDCPFYLNYDNVKFIVDDNY